MKFYITYLIHYYCNLQYILPNIGSLWFEHNYSSTQMRCLTNPALARIYYSENIRFERMLVGCTKISFKLIAIDHSANSLYVIFYYITDVIIYYLIPRRLERRTHPYQKYALPIKLRNPYITKNVYTAYCKIFFRDTPSGGLIKSSTFSRIKKNKWIFFFDSAWGLIFFYPQTLLFFRAFPKINNLSLW